jgi:hypothetical protein
LIGLRGHPEEETVRALLRDAELEEFMELEEFIMCFSPFCCAPVVHRRPELLLVFDEGLDRQALEEQLLEVGLEVPTIVLTNGTRGAASRDSGMPIFELASPLSTASLSDALATVLGPPKSEVRATGGHQYPPPVWSDRGEHGPE